jgi:hypothetical protein
MLKITTVLCLEMGSYLFVSNITISSSVHLLHFLIFTL